MASPAHELIFHTPIKPEHFELREAIERHLREVSYKKPKSYKADLDQIIINHELGGSFVVTTEMFRADVREVGFSRSWATVIIY